MKIVVTGGTGFIGTPLIRELLSSGHSVTALTRDATRAEERLPARCEIRQWDGSSELDPGEVSDADAVIHLAGEGIADGRWTAKRKREILSSRVDTAARLIAALRRVDLKHRPKVLVSASAIGWYGDRGSSLLDESSPAGDGFLAEVCRAWEEEARGAEDLGLRTVRVRTGVVLGRGGGALARLLPLFRLGLGGRVGSGRQWMSWIHLDDMVALLRFVVDDHRVTGPINAVAPEPVTNAEFTSTLAHVLHRPALLPVPSIALRLALGEMSSVVLGSQRVQPSTAKDVGFRFRLPNLRQALQELCEDSSREIVAEQWLADSPERVFRFFSDPMNLEKITPKFLNFRVRGTTTNQIEDGTLIDYSLRLHGFPLRWQSRIESWKPNQVFVDVQTRGPYRLWHHTHEFREENGGTLIRDKVRYELPFGSLGDLVAGKWVRHDLEEVFRFRRERIARLVS